MKITGHFKGFTYFFVPLDNCVLQLQQIYTTFFDFSTFVHFHITFLFMVYSTLPTDENGHQYPSSLLQSRESSQDVTQQTKHLKT